MEVVTPADDARTAIRDALQNVMSIDTARRGADAVLGLLRTDPAVQAVAVGACMTPYRTGAGILAYRPSAAVAALLTGEADTHA